MHFSALCRFLLDQFRPSVSLSAHEKSEHCENGEIGIRPAVTTGSL